MIGNSWGVRFTVHAPGGEERHYEHGSTYELESCALMVWDALARRAVVFGPFGWLRVENEPECDTQQRPLMALT